MRAFGVCYGVSDLGQRACIKALDNPIVTKVGEIRADFKPLFQFSALIFRSDAN